jgi:hypothetical protein
LWLLHGNFEQGWAEYEWRWTQSKTKPRAFSRPLWDGTDLRGRTILLYAEQGLGDVLQFMRYVPFIKALGAKVILESPSRLVRLMAGMPRIDQLLTADEPLPAFDFQMPLLSLPHILHTSETTIPSISPYLHPDPQLTTSWRQQLKTHIGNYDESPHSNVRKPRSAATSTLDSHSAPRTSHFRVGIAWQGDPAFVNDRQRSIPLRQFAPLANVSGVQLISLQKGAGTEQMVDGGWLTVNGEEKKEQSNGQSEGGKPFSLTTTVHCPPSTFDETSGPFMDTAAIMKNVDLVVTCDTVIAHLAGALGVPVWVALAHVPDWRWQLHRADSPWYPTMRLFRQNRAGDWQGVFERIANELKALVQVKRVSTVGAIHDQQLCPPLPKF